MKPHTATSQAIMTGNCCREDVGTADQSRSDINLIFFLLFFLLEVHLLLSQMTASSDVKLVQSNLKPYPSANLLLGGMLRQ